MPINVTIQQGDPLPLARLLNSGGVPPRAVDVVWQTEPTSVADPRTGLFPFITQGEAGYEVLISPDPTCQPGVTYEGVLRGTVTDANSNTLVRDLDVAVTIASPPSLTVSWTNLQADAFMPSTMFDLGNTAGTGGWLNPAADQYDPVTPITSAPITDPTVVTDVYAYRQNGFETYTLTFSSYDGPLNWSYVDNSDLNVTVTLGSETGATNSTTYVLVLDFNTPATGIWYENVITVTATNGVISSDLTFNLASFAPLGS